MSLEGKCHCGAVHFTLNENFAQIAACNHSICHRLGTLWGHGPIENLAISANAGTTPRYSRGDKNMALHTCKTCGWQPIGKI